MKKIFHALLAGVIALAVSSCSDNNGNNEMVYIQPVSGCYEYVTDLMSDAVAGYSSIGYNVQYNYSRMTAAVSISNLRLPDGTSFPTISLADLPMEVTSNGWITINARDVVPSIPGMAVVPTFNTFRLSVFNRDISDLIPEAQGQQFNNPAFCVRITIDNKYSILSGIPSTYLFGTTEVVSGEGERNVTSNTKYVVSINPETKVADILLQGASFVPGMPALDIQLASVPFTVNGSTITIAAESVTPKIGGDPFPAFPITNLKGVYDLNEGMDLTFHCNPRTTPQEYDVTADLTFSLPK